MREEGGRNVAAISAQHHALDAADDALEERQPAPAWAAAAGRHGEVAELVAEERDATVVQVGHEHLADLAVGCRPAVAYHLHDVALGVHVVSTVRLALVRDTAELPRAVLVEHAAAELPLDELPGLRRECLRGGDDGPGAEPVDRLGLQQRGDHVERLGVAVEQRRLPAPHVADVAPQRLVVEREHGEELPP